MESVVQGSLLLAVWLPGGKDRARRVESLPVTSAWLPPAGREAPGLYRHTIKLLGQVSSQAWDSIHLFPVKLLSHVPDMKLECEVTSSPQEVLKIFFFLLPALCMQV